MKPLPPTICRHCGSKVVPFAKVARVLQMARVPTRVGVLAAAYCSGTDLPIGTGRRAITRMAKRGLLDRIAEGVYLATTNLEFDKDSSR